MSSILDALRKVEAEKTKETVDLGEVEEMLAEKELLVPEEEEPRPPVRGVNKGAIVAASAALVVLFAVGGFLLYGRLTGGRRTGETENRATGLVPTGIPRAAAPKPLRFPIEERRVEPAAAPVVQPRAPAPPAEQTAAEPEPTTAEEEAPEPPAPPAEPVTAAAPEEAPAVAKPAGQRPTLKINILRPPSEQFPEPLAIVNRKKVTVGDTVDGAKVMKIQSDGILFDYSGELFLVPF